MRLYDDSPPKKNSLIQQLLWEILIGFHSSKLPVTSLALAGWLINSQIRVISRARLFGSGSGLKLTKILGLIWAWDVLFALIGAQKYNQNNLATLLKFSDLT